MPTPLTVHNAEIHTATVEIKTLTVSGKQVTLAVFRQLQKEPLMGQGGALRGVPWGYVNYHPQCVEVDRYPHWHVVWQKGAELRVDTIATTGERQAGYQGEKWLDGNYTERLAVAEAFVRQIRALPQLFIAV